MLKTALAVLISTALMFAAPAFAVDGVVLINQSTVMAQGGLPYKITQPGSYKLSGNLDVPATVTGIFIQTSGVTIDLNGFRISGSGGGAGIFGANADTTIRNGSIVGFSEGIELEGGSSTLVEEIRATGNSFAGIGANDAVIRRNITSSNGTYGINATSSTVTENVCNFNGHFGLVMSQGVFGSNTLDGNHLGSVTGGVSQKNNDCDGTVC